MNLRRKGFTLIELLVVISVVGLLSAVVTAGLNSAREKGRLAGARQFASLSSRAAGDQAVGIWDFDDCLGSAAVDRSGFGNNGTLTNMTLPNAWVSGYSGTRCALSFDGTDDYVSTSYVKVSGDGTVSAWFKTDSQTSDSGSYIRPILLQGDFDGAGTGVNPQGILISMGRQGHADYGKIRFDWGTDDNFYTTSRTYLDDRWHHVLMSKSGTTLSIYIDGLFVASHVATDSVDTTPALEIGGSSAVPARKFQGEIDEVRVFDKALSATEVHTLYARGAERRGFASTQR